MRSIRPSRPMLGEALLDAFARRLTEQDLSPVTDRGYRHDLERFRCWIEADRGAVPLASIIGCGHPR